MTSTVPPTTASAAESSDLPAVAAVIVLAAGGGTRMKSRKSKLLHEVAGRPMLSYAVDAAEELEPDRLVVVVGHEREQVQQHLQDVAPTVTIAVQQEQRGTGHAVRCAIEVIGELSGTVVVSYGDVPMLTGTTLIDLVLAHQGAHNAVTVLTAQLADPTGYGRVVREGGQVSRIVEQKDATEAEAEITEINSGIYAFDAPTLLEGLAQLDDNNAQGELYLTDVIGYATGQGRPVGAYLTEDLWQTEGVNDRVQLAAMNVEMNRRIVTRWMREGVTVLDPATTWIQDGVDLATDVTLKPNTSLEGATSIGEGATIGPDTTLIDVEVGAGATITRSHGWLAVIGEGAEVGPFAYLRPGTELGTEGKIGTFVETKNAKIGAGAKVPHLSYVGDAYIDQGANIGAGTIFANYDGVNKSPSHVGKDAFIGSNSVLVAPVDIGDGGFVAAGSTVTEDVAPGELTVARGRQHHSTGWIARTRPGSKWDAAAQESAAQVHQAVAAKRDELKGDQA